MSEQKKKIIIIDDVELNRAILSEAFSKKYDVIEANDGSEGLNKIYENHKERFSTSVFKVGLISFALYFVFSVVVFIYGVFYIRNYESLWFLF